jgi:hypothetical protein
MRALIPIMPFGTIDPSFKIVIYKFSTFMVIICWQLLFYNILKVVDGLVFITNNIF